jgi:hypothetical protein
MLSTLGLLLALKIVPATMDVAFKQPQVASTGDMLGVTFGAGSDFYYSFSTNEGETFSRPVKVETKGKMSLGRHRGPRIAYQAGNVVISAIVGEKGGGQDGDVLVWRSNDNGKSWSKPSRANDVAGAAREGLHSMTSGNGWVVVTWLDLRDKGTRIYGSRSDDGGATWSKNFLVYESPDGSVCQCCHPTVVVGASGRLYVMWRNALSGNRDMYLATSEDGGRSWHPAKKIGNESWQLNACPMDGGGLALSGQSKPYAVFRKDKEIHYSTPGAIERMLGEGKDPAIATGLGEALYVVWTSSTGAIEATTSKENQVRTLAAKGAYPQVIFTSRQVLAFWEEEDGIGMGVVEGRAVLNAAPGKAGK